ncbi:MAG: LptA/OstA family protein [Deinococcota bacterium]
MSVSRGLKHQHIQQIVTLMLVSGLLASFGHAQDNRPQLRLTRNDRTIQVIQNAPSNEGGKFHLRAPCEEDVRLNTVFAPEPYLVETRVNDTLMTSSIVMDRRPDGRQDEATLELFGGSLEVDERFCPTDVTRTDTPDVTVYQGRTTITGITFTYNNATGLGTLDGPVTLEREQEGISPLLEATADAMVIDVDRDITTLEGNTSVSSDGRVSDADEVEYDEAGSRAILRGSPAVSEKDGDIVQGNVIEYDLDSNDVVVKGGISATFEFDR